MNIKKDWKIIKPAPTDKTIEEIKSGLKGFPKAHWVYYSQDKSIHHLRILYVEKSGKKKILPLTYGCLAGVTGWHFKGPDKPFPLYNLPELNDRLRDPVLVVEGEKTAIAASKLLPNFVIITSAGGAQAYKDTDFSPLAGRNVTIWRDNDAAGIDYQEGVIRKLRAIKVGSVSIVELPEGLPEGFDLADQWPVSFGSIDIEHIVQTAKKLDLSDLSFTKFWAPFESRADGIYFLKWNKATNALAEVTKICAKIDVLSLARTDESTNWSKIVQFKDHDGVRKEVMILAADFVREGQVQALLQSYGLPMHHSKKMREKVVEYLAWSTPDERVYNSSRIGWHRPTGENIFAFPSTSIGKNKLILHPRLNKDPYSTKGSLQDWKNNVAQLASGNSRLMFAISASLCAPLIYPLQIESFGVNIFGSSSCGKTTCLEVAASVWGLPSEIIQQWRATDNGLEAIAARSCDAALILDEIGMIDPDILGRMTYMLANNKGKLRALQDGGAARVQEWRLLFLSSGEMTLPEKIKQGRTRRVYAGQTVRVLDVSADAKSGMGAFEYLHTYDSPKALADGLKKVSKQCYGSAATAFITKLTESSFRDLQIEFDSFKAEFFSLIPEGYHAQASRVMSRFAAIAYAGLLGVRFEILPWDLEELKSAVFLCADAWIKNSSNPKSSSDVNEGIKHLQTFMRINMDSGFHKFTNNAGATAGVVTENFTPRIKTYGYCKMEDGEDRIFYIFPDVMKYKILNDYNTHEIMMELFHSGHLKPGESGRLACKVRIPGYDASQRVYAIKQSIFDLNFKNSEVEDAIQ